MTFTNIRTEELFKHTIQADVSDVPNRTEGFTEKSKKEYVITGVSVTWAWIEDTRTYHTRHITLTLRRVLKSGRISDHVESRTTYGDPPQWLARFVSDHTPEGYLTAVRRGAVREIAEANDRV